MKSTIDSANQNLLQLMRNIYPGRGIVVGVDETGKYIFHVYWIMGRSPNSRNRIFITGEEGEIKTDAADPSKVEDPSLIIYTAMFGNGSSSCHAVSNGHQTKDARLYGNIEHGLLTPTFTKAWKYEPDAPIYTSRVQAISFRNHGDVRHEMSIMRKSPFSDACHMSYHSLPDIAPGYGCCIHAYKGDGDPPPAFVGEPYFLPFVGSMENVGQMIWDALDENNRVALAVKSIRIDTGEIATHIINKYEKVLA